MQNGPDGAVYFFCDGDETDDETVGEARDETEYHASGLDGAVYFFCDENATIVYGSNDRLSGPLVASVIDFGGEF